MRQLIPFTCFAGFLTSLLGLFWYDALTSQEKEEANQMAEQMALKLYRKSFATLTPAQANVVDGYVHRQFRE